VESLRQKIKTELNESLKKKDEIGRSVLGMLLAVVINKELAKGKELIDEEIVEIIFSEVKKRKESVAAFEKGNRKDLADKERSEIKVLQKYLPEQMPEEDLRKIIKEAIGKTEALTVKDMGRVMAEIMPQVKGKADSSLISKIVRESLGQKF
jgi:uncharacterized protein YqeY